MSFTDKQKALRTEVEEANDNLDEAARSIEALHSDLQNEDEDIDRETALDQIDLVIAEAEAGLDMAKAVRKTLEEPGGEDSDVI
jgi:hypothetical protein